MSKVKTLASLAPGEGSLPGLWTAAFSLCPHMAFPGCVLCERELWNSFLCFFLPSFLSFFLPTFFPSFFLPEIGGCFLFSGMKNSGKK